MKKTILFLTLLLILTGCGKKEPEIIELNCTKTVSDKQSSVVYENKYTYEEEKLTKAETDTTLTFTTEGIVNLETFKTYAESSKDEYNKKEGVKAKLTTNDNSINIVVTYNPDKMIDDEIENNKFNLNTNDLRKALEKEGYTCK